MAAEWSDKVVGITDGDTIRVMHNGLEEKIRLTGIDCPEHNQDYGSRAKQAASELAFGKVVTVRSSGKDKYGRTLAEIILPDGSYLQHHLLQQGLAWWYRQYSTDQTLGQLEDQAKAAKVGLWSMPNPIAPWDFRHNGGAGTQSSSTLVAPSGGVGARAPPASADSTVAPSDSQDMTVYTTRTGTKYHSAGCRYLKKSSIPMNLTAAKMSCTPCSVCGPPR